ncbi:MAG: RMD1 family protein [Cellvibrionaceae bacterium]
MKFSNDKIDTVVLGRHFDYQKIGGMLNGEHKLTRYREVSLVELSGGEVWLFDYGVLIFWGVEEKERIDLIGVLKSCIEDPLEKAEYERYRFVLNSDDTKIHQDIIYLSDNATLNRLAVSHAFAQSIKLSVFEDLAQAVIEDNASIPRTLAKTGKISVSRSKLAQKRGVLFSTKSDILLNFNLLDTPEFFWDYPELESLYLLSARYLDVLPRVNLLSKKLETIHELLEMLANEQNHKHSSFLEWIIIILIAVEIVLFFWH